METKRGERKRHSGKHVKKKKMHEVKFGDAFEKILNRRERMSS